MRCTLLSQYYPPETGACANRISDWARRLAAAGHYVTVVTPLPNYPKRQIYEAYRRRWLVEETAPNLRVLRTWIYVRDKDGFLSRLSTYFSFMIASMIVGLLKLRSQDVIIIESPPLFLGIAGLALKIVLRSKLLFNVSDLWPETAVAMGVLRNRLIIRLSIALEELIYRHSNLITGQTEGIVTNIRSRITHVPVVKICNGVDLEEYFPSVNSRATARGRFGFDGGFVVGYAGLHGLAQGLETVLDAAEMLSDKRDIVFVFFGDGVEKASLRNQACRRNLKNVRFYPPEPHAEMPAIMSSFDAALVPLRNLKPFRGALPSKLFEYMAAGVPVIVAIDGEARKLVADSGAGIYVAPEDPAQLAAAILKLRTDPALGRQMGENGRRHVARCYNRREQAYILENCLYAMTGKSGSDCEDRDHHRSSATIH